MRRYSLLAATALLFAASCAQPAKTDEQVTGTSADKEVSVTDPAKVPEVKDPVCGMPKDGTWTEYSISGSDTTWFCSPHCKETFAKKQTAKPQDSKG